MDNYYLDDPFIRTYMMPANYLVVNNQSNFVSADEGFLRGNMEKGTYIPYKNMNYVKPMLSSQKQKDLYELQKICFAAHDANLYLDTHPTDNNMIKLYNEYLMKEKELEKNYEQKYGPLNLNDSTKKTPWAWIEKPWPWEVSK